MNDADIEQVLAVDAERCNALVEKDIGTLGRLTADDYTHTETSGQVRDKAGFLAFMARKDFRFTRWVIEENRVRIYGDTAVVTGRYFNTVKDESGEHPPKYARHIRVYVRRDGQWLNVAHQATRI